MNQSFSMARDPVAPLPRPPPKLSAKQLAVKMLSRAPPPVSINPDFDEEDEMPNSGEEKPRFFFDAVAALLVFDCHFHAHFLQAPGLPS
jgi:hypothetical protein